MGASFHESPKIGAMVELPSAVVGIEDLAEETDFLSIGTNDLIMYLLAVDRTNERLSELYRSHHPVVLRTLAEVARRVGDKVDKLSVCGEAAADPLMIPFFLGIGIRTLSVAPTMLKKTRSTVSTYTQQDAVDFASEVQSIRALKQMDVFLKSYRHPAPA
jgi:phosphoenolpyruvate-protein kinase (PTS system EI component)